MSAKQPIKISADVQAAIASGKPAVAFETTVLSFGLPAPQNLEIGRQCQQIVTRAGVQPATLGLVDGEVRIGLADEELQRFCHSGAAITKVNLQNMAAAITRREMGAFTVAASMQICAEAGLRVFATGGIGGIHRDYARFHDASSDLAALARFPVAVICAGVKSILDVPATIEHLETLGVPIIGYKTDRFPLFHARNSLLELETWTDRADEVAQIIQNHWALNGRGIVIVTPVPEQYAIPINELEDWIAAALRAAQTGRVTGKAVTPYLLKKLEELSHGRTLTANMALLENNACAAAQIALALQKQQTQTPAR